jgi:hypothetical protein
VALCEELSVAASSPSGTVIAAPPQPGFTQFLLDLYTGINLSNLTLPSNAEATFGLCRPDPDRFDPTILPAPYGSFPCTSSPAVHSQDSSYGGRFHQCIGVFPQQHHSHLSGSSSAHIQDYWGPSASLSYGGHHHSVPTHGGHPGSILSYVFGSHGLAPVSHGGYPHAPTSVASSLGNTQSLLWPLLHGDACSSSESYVTMSFPQGVPPVGHSLPVLPPAVVNLPAMPSQPAVAFHPVATTLVAFQLMVAPALIFPPSAAPSGVFCLLRSLLFSH